MSTSAHLSEVIVVVFAEGFHRLKLVYPYDSVRRPAIVLRSWSIFGGGGVRAQRQIFPTSLH